MKMKVMNMKFMDATFSFGQLKIYHQHVVELMARFAEGVQESGERLEAEYRLRGTEFNKQNWDGFHRIFSESYPGFFNNSFLISTCSVFEHRMEDLCYIVKEEHKMPYDWDHIPRFKGTIPAKAKTYLARARIEFKDDPPHIQQRPPDFAPVEVYDENRVIVRELWEALDNYFMVRNCLAHENGFVQKARNEAKLRKYAIEKDIVADKGGRPVLVVTKAFNYEVCDTMEKYFWRLTSAYYSTALPN